MRVVDLGPRSRATGGSSDSRQRVLLEVMPHVLAGCVPDGQQNALSFVAAGAVLVRLSEIANRDRPVNGGDDLGQLDVFGILCENVTTTDATLRSNESRALQREKDLLEVRLRKTRAFGNVAH